MELRAAAPAAFGLVPVRQPAAPPPMKLHYFKEAPNFGDALNPWLWPQLLPGILDEDTSRLFLGIGTILNNRIPRAGAYHVLGSGAGYGPPPDIDGRWHFHAVRGPLTAQALGLAPTAVATDSAYLLRLVALPAPSPGPALGFMPHFRNLRHVPWRRICRLLGLRFLDPLAPVPITLAAIRGCSCVVAEAMHGAIAADALRIPWIPVATSPHILDFKWQDWFCSLGLQAQLRRLGNLARATSHTPGDSKLCSTMRRSLNLTNLIVRLIPLVANLRILVHQIQRCGLQPLLSSPNASDQCTAKLVDALGSFRSATT
jgi:succinoglycan biosynthesis protein ExoV